MAFAIRAAMLFFAAALLAAGIWLSAMPYHAFTETVFRAYGQPEKLARFRDALLTPERFAALRWVSLCLGVLCAGFAAAVWRRVPALVRQTGASLGCIALALRNFWHQTPPAERLVAAAFFAVVFAARLHFMFRLPLHVDERFTYLYFVSKGWAVSAVYYPNPNNHILFSLLCNLAGVFLDGPLPVLRLPALLAGMAALAGFWLSARYYFSAGVALCAAALFAFTPVVFGYGIQGRGYGLLLCCTIAACFSLVKIVSSQNAKPPHRAIFVVASVLGFYAVPVFLYPFAGMCAYAAAFLLWKRRYAPLARLLWLAALVAAGVFLLYLPVFVFNGWHAVSGNGWVAPLAWNDFRAGIAANLAGCSRILWHDLPFSWCLTLAFGAAAAAAMASKKTPSAQKHWLALYLCCLWVVVPVVLLQRTLLYGRVLVYIFPLQWLAFALLANGWLSGGFGLLKRYYSAIASTLLLLYAGHCLAQFRTLSLPEGRGIYNSLDSVSNWLYQRRADRVFVQYYEYGLCIRFACETNGRAIDLDVGADRLSVRKRYNFVVVHQSNRFPAGLPAADYRLAYADGQARIFELKQH